VPPKARASAKDKLRAYFEARVGKVIDTRRLRSIGGVSEYARRIRELRNDEGMQIQTHLDSPALRPGQYVLVSLERSPLRVSHKIDRAQRARILERNGYTCCMCGLAAGDPEPDSPVRKIRLHVDHADPDGPTTDENLRVTCNVCNEGRSNLEAAPAPKMLSVLRQVRRLPRRDQWALLEDLKARLGSD
jgi:5-methylcytosine-specific restriction endonuclease McrA